MPGPSRLLLRHQGLCTARACASAPAAGSRSYALRCLGNPLARWLSRRSSAKPLTLSAGPGGLASFLRRQQLGARLGGPSLRWTWLQARTSRPQGEGRGPTEHRLAPRDTTNSSPEDRHAAKPRTSVNLSTRPVSCALSCRHNDHRRIEPGLPSVPRPGRRPCPPTRLRPAHPGACP